MVLVFRQSFENGSKYNDNFCWRIFSEFNEKKKKERGLLVHSIFLIMFTCGLCQKYFVEIAVHTEVIEVSLQTSSKIPFKEDGPTNLLILHFAF